MKLFYKCVSLLTSSLISFLTITTLNAQKIDPLFDTNKIIKQVSDLQRLNESRNNEFPVDTNIIYIPAQNSQYCPAVAFDGTNYFIVWEDKRLGFGIYGARVSSSGEILDSAGITISTAYGLVEWVMSPSVTFDGTNYFVVWQYGRHGYSYDIYGARISPSGVVLDPDGIAISTAVNCQVDPSVAFDGTNYFVVWTDTRNSTDIYGARVTQSGTVLDPDGIAISTASNIQRYPSIIFDDTNYLVVWEDFRPGISINIYGARVAPSGVVLDPDGIAISDTSVGERPSVSFGGSNYLVVWNDHRNGVDFDIYGARVAQSGTVLDPDGIAISTTADDQLYPTVTFSDTNFLVVWTDYYSDTSIIYGARISQSGVVLDPDGIAISTGGYGFSSVGFDGVNYFTVYHYSSDIYGTRVSQDGVVLDPDGIIISMAGNSQYWSAIAFDGTNYLVVWTDGRETMSSDIYGMRISSSGFLLDSVAFVVSDAARNQHSPQVAFNGSNYLVVWDNDNNGDIYGARVSPSGVVLDPDGIAISDSGNAWSCAVASDGVNYFVVWTDARPGSNYYDIYGARVSQSGEVLDPGGIVISDAVEGQFEPAIAFNGRNYFVVWSDARNSYWPPDIYGARVNKLGVVLDPAGIAISLAFNFQFTPSIVSGDTNYLIVWEDYRNDPTPWMNNPDIYGARVTPSGVVLDTQGIAICTDTCRQILPDVAFDGDDYVVVWQDNRKIFKWHIFGAILNQAGLIIDSFIAASESRHNDFPALAHGNDDQIFITYYAWTDSINSHPANTFRIWGTFYPFTGIEEDEGLQTPTQKFPLEVYPNPVHKKCNIKYILPQNTKVNICIYDVTGRLIKEIINESQNVGIHNKTFGVTDLSQGIYFIRLNTENYTDTEKIILIK